jgi:DNA-directed RNA polymerase specialized sigma24 family protein
VICLGPIRYPMKKDWALTQEAFDRLLDWLNPDREQAGKKYEAIRMRLIKIFSSRACREAEFLADETINRVTAKVEEVSKDYVGDPALYFYAVAQKVYLENLRKDHKLQSSLPAEPAALLSAPAAGLMDDFEAEYQCLEACLASLPRESRDLVVRYYEHEGQAKIEHRKALAVEGGIALNAVRIRAHRIRRGLRKCVRNCLAKQSAN